MGRRVAALLVAMLLTGCSSAASPAPSTQAGSPGVSAPAGTTNPGSATPAASGVTDPLAHDGPLPEPALRSIDQIIAALDDPEQAEQVVVSLLSLLGIGLYGDDGNLIRKGTETSDTDFYLHETMARGLAAMVRERAEAESQMSFTDFHAALVQGGYSRSIDELATGYATAYAAAPDAPVSNLVAALGPIDVNASIPAFEAWLLLLDGFIPPNSATTAVANAAAAPPAVAAGGSGWGIAQRNLLNGGLTPEWAAVSGRLSALIHGWDVVVTVSPQTVHEGHGANGAPASVTARLVGPRTPLVSPFSGSTIVPAPTGPAGAPIAWYADRAAPQHGTVTDGVTPADSSGSASTTYVPQQEDADGQGIEREDVGVIHAGVQRRELALALYGSFIAPYAVFMQTHVKSYALLDIDWHERAEAVIKIIWTDFYNGVEDRITFLGDITDSMPDGNGGTIYTGTGTATGSRAGWTACNPGIDTAPSGTGPATFNGYLTGDGRITISAYADALTALAGISTAPMTVPLSGGTAVFTSSETGDLCPHSSDGELTLTGLTLP